jgi:multidrug resistance efflux pump
MDRLISNKEQKAVAAAAREAAKAKRLEQEARLNLLRQQLAEAEAQAAAAATEVTHADVTIEQLALEARISTGSNQRVVKRSWKSTRRFLLFSWRLLYFCNAYFLLFRLFAALFFTGCKFLLSNFQKTKICSDVNRFSVTFTCY